MPIIGIEEALLSMIIEDRLFPGCSSEYRDTLSAFKEMVDAWDKSTISMIFNHYARSFSGPADAFWHHWREIAGPVLKGSDR